jgi:hypothetical protein
MHSSHPQQSLANNLLNQLASEEALLRSALAGSNEIFAALRRGDLTAALAFSAEQQTHADALHEAAKPRAEAANALACDLGLTGEELTLTTLAAKLPSALAGEMLAARDRLRAVTAELNSIQARNANLLGHLRSFFRGVLTDLTIPTAPQRYGPSGSRVESATGAAG